MFRTLVLCGLFSLISSEAAAQVEQLRLERDASVYPVMSLSVRPVAAIMRGVTVTVLSRSGEWTLVQFGQQKQQGYIRLGDVAGAPTGKASEHPAAAPAGENVIRWAAGAPGADRVLADGVTVKSLAAQGVRVFVTLQDTGWKTRADVFVRNETDTRFDVLPDDFTLTVVRPKLKPLRYRSTAEMENELKKKDRWEAIANAFVAATATTEVTTESTWSSRTSGRFGARDDYGSAIYGRYSGTTRGAAQTTTTQPDEFARAVAFENLRSQQDDLAAALAYLRSVSFKANTLLPGEEVMGAVFFDREKKAEGLVVRIPIGSLVFEFPFGDAL